MTVNRAIETASREPTTTSAAADAMPANKAERLALAAAVAPSLRKRAARARARPVARVAADGTVVGYATLADVQEKILERAKIELAVDGKRPEHSTCERCGRIFRLRKSGVIPRACPPCTRLSCVGCGTALSPAVSNPRWPTRRLGLPPRCRPCAVASRKRPSCDQCDAAVRDRKTKLCRPCRLASVARLRCSRCDAVMPKASCTPGARKKRGDRPVLCLRCAQAPKPRPSCADCGVVLGLFAMTPEAVAKRRGEPPRCNPCAAKKRSLDGVGGRVLAALSAEPQRPDDIARAIGEKSNNVRTVLYRLVHTGEAVQIEGRPVRFVKGLGGS